MPDDAAPEPIPFDRVEPKPPGVLQDVSPLIRRIVAPNGGPMTFTGTCTYVVGRGDVAVIDPGPDMPEHRTALLAALGSERVRHIFVTHTHRDHAPGARPLAAETGAPILGCAPHRASVGGVDEQDTLERANDTAYAPHTVLADGQSIAGAGYTLAAVATPGHTANHLAFALREENALFSGDHVMAWSTSVVMPPDGSMAAYMESLAKVAARPEETYWPGHGGPVRNPHRFVRALLAHRRYREAIILRAVRAGTATIPALVDKIYVGLAPALRGAAGLSVFAHLEDLVRRNELATDGVPKLGGHYRPS